MEQQKREAQQQRDKAKRLHDQADELDPDRAADGNDSVRRD